MAEVPSTSQTTPKTFYFNPMPSWLLPVPSACPQPVLFLQGSLPENPEVPRGTPAKNALLAATLPGQVASLASLALGS